MNTSEAVRQWQNLVLKESQDFYKITTPIESRNDQDARTIIVKWAYRVVDKYDLDRSIVSFATSYFDRCMSLYSRLDDLACTQLLAITCLYIGAKLHGSRTNPLTISTLVRISKGYFDAKQIFEMEKRLINILGWHLNPPVPILFIETVKHLLYKNKNLSVTKKDAIYDVAVYLIELSICDHFFVPKRPSSIAAAALQVAMEIAGCNLAFPLQALLEPKTKEMAYDSVLRMRKLLRSSNMHKEEASRCSESSPTDVMTASDGL